MPAAAYAHKGDCRMAFLQRLQRQKGCSAVWRSKDYNHQGPRSGQRNGSQSALPIDLAGPYGSTATVAQIVKLKI